MERFSTLEAVFDAPLEHLQEVDGIGGTASVLIGLIPHLLGRYQQDRWTHTQVFASTVRLWPISLLCLPPNVTRSSIYWPQQPQCVDCRGTDSAGNGEPRRSLSATGGGGGLEAPRNRGDPRAQPSGGDPRPSSADRQLTRKLKKVLSDLDIAVHDHIIVAGPDTSFSFAEHGELE